MSDTEKKQSTDEEPTMEEILTSIRRIISDDSGGEEKRSENNAEGDSGESISGEDLQTGSTVSIEDEPPLVLAETDIEEEELTDSNDELKLSESDIIEDTRVAAIEEDSEKLSASEAVAKVDEKLPLMSETQAASAAETLAGLSDALTQGQGIQLGSSDKTLEQIVKDLLRPMLQTWLDRNLPPLVEKLVKKEIEKLVNRAEDQG